MYNEEKFVVPERFVWTLKKKTYKYMAAISKGLYIGNYNNKCNKCNSTYHRTIKMEPNDINSKTHIELGVENNDKDPRFRVGD